MEENTKKPQLTAEEELTNLKYYCQQLMEQNKQLQFELAKISSVVNKLPWLFKVLEQESFFDTDFIEECVYEITEILKPAESESESKTSEE